ncbi:hypothetical protein J3Q64DRAFT_1852397 [Phycomyces blakesleeanus]|uniref:Uncharacterized protein n=1 Tax=Phycomyces blakesleeanus TaxID=4837 RepID=A0ABR3APP8_PHYBL
MTYLPSAKVQKAMAAIINEIRASSQDDVENIIQWVHSTMEAKKNDLVNKPIIKSIKMEQSLSTVLGDETFSLAPTGITGLAAFGEAKELVVDRSTCSVVTERQSKRRKSSELLIKQETVAVSSACDTDTTENTDQSNLTDNSEEIHSFVNGKRENLVLNRLEKDLKKLLSMATYEIRDIVKRRIDVLEFMSTGLFIGVSSNLFQLKDYTNESDESLILDIKKTTRKYTAVKSVPRMVHVAKNFSMVAFYRIMKIYMERHSLPLSYAYRKIHNMDPHDFKGMKNVYTMYKCGKNLAFATLVFQSDIILLLPELFNLKIANSMTESTWMKWESMSEFQLNKKKLAIIWREIEADVFRRH